MNPAVGVAWWTPDAPLSHPGPAGVQVIGLTGQSGRPDARAAIRAALHATLRERFGLAAPCIALHTAPGTAPHALLDHATGARRVWLSISHDGALSVAALRPDGPVGIDAMGVADVPDCCDVARDYLGPDAAAALARLPAPARADAFAHAWTAHEARLKCLGRAIDEWNAELGRLLAACAVRPLILPPGYAGHLALA